jgi:hypothetical protein
MWGVGLERRHRRDATSTCDSAPAMHQQKCRLGASGSTEPYGFAGSRLLITL